MADDNQGREVSMTDLLKTILTDPGLTPEQKKSLVDEVRKNSPALSDRWLYRWVIWFLGVTVVLAVICLALLAGLGKEIPQGLVALGSAAAGGLAGLLAPSPRAKQNE
ncbi:hypothetical protein [Archangium lansingense]|uniref:DUF3040 domain-containing protein n=1 Tax=Archangium lansingense TaxID=2995310 RepID=A0ABT3ZY09_9BACT|nr:hypothetical protein [Archangium lansinium]MCY1074290.1 hypothetical protein [Archangium lansinium]